VNSKQEKRYTNIQDQTVKQAKAYFKWETECRENGIAITQEMYKKWKIQQAKSTNQ